MSPSPVLLPAASTAPLPAPEPKAAIEGRPLAAVSELWAAGGGSRRAGIWECTPGAFRTERVGYDEVVVILAGRGALQPDDGDEVAHEAGDVVVIPDGFRGVWRVDETIRKAYVVVAS